MVLVLVLACPVLVNITVELQSNVCRIAVESRSNRIVVSPTRDDTGKVREEDAATQVGPSNRSALGRDCLPMPREMLPTVTNVKVIVDQMLLKRG